MTTAFSRALSATTLALLGAALVAGCSSTTSGSASLGGGAGASAAAPRGVFASPGSGAGASGGGAGTSGGSGNFCHDWSTINSDLTHITPGDVREKLVSKFDTLAAEAPAAVKADVQRIDQYVHSLLSGSPDPSKAQQFGQAFGHVGVWIAENC